MISPADPVRAAAASAPSTSAVIDHEGIVTYGDLDRAVDARAAALAALGVRRGDRVAMSLPNDRQAVITVHAVGRAGGVLVPLHPSWPRTETEACVTIVQPRLLIAPEGSDWRSPRTEVVAVSALPAAEAVADAFPAPADLHTILWTSGTSGAPRGVALTWGNHFVSAAGAARRLDLTSNDCWYAALPLAHVGGLALILRAAVTRAAVYAPGTFGAEGLAQLIDAGTITHASLVPTMLRRLIAVRGDRPAPAGLRALLIGGAALPNALLDVALARGYPIALTYGLSEASSQVATAAPALVRRKPGCVGEALDGVELRIAADGEILVRGPTIMRGYVGAEDVSRPDGWLATGDLGQLDDQGHLWVHGRTSDRIITGGVNVDPSEVLRVLEEHDAVRDAAVIGLPDDEWGEIVVAFLVPAGTADAASELDVYVREHLAPAKRPRRFVTLAELPRNANGKIDVAALRQIVERRPSATAPNP